jgi:hypothetical protein
VRRLAGHPSLQRVTHPPAYSSHNLHPPPQPHLHMGNLVAGNLVQQVLGLRGQALSLPAADGLRAAAAQLLVQGGAVASALVEVGLLRGCGAGGASRG